MSYKYVTQLPSQIYVPPPPTYIGPSNLSSLQNFKFNKNVTLPQVFSCILLVQYIYLVSPEVETLPKWILAGTKRQSNKQPLQPAINLSNSTL